jgi:hypothetical protein
MNGDLSVVLVCHDLDALRYLDVLASPSVMGWVDGLWHSADDPECSKTLHAGYGRLYK